MFNINIGDMLDMCEVLVEVYVEDTLINKQKMQAPSQMLMASFLQTVKEISNDPRPMKLKMIRPKTIWDNFENKQKVINCDVSFSNNIMVAWENDRKEREANS